ncbi:hypothetical protein PRZ48_004983 [Zasmidium cellare]|uniref:Uncharacterized protein n=1 Tax=Zasmidium cellare TaxID=395010 RepID=A0ABR0ET99_ZASCE|nr:hypothetical protein PRZ48_004983 [Zasmidium cellare]
MVDPRARPKKVEESPTFRNNRLFVGFNASKQACFFGILPAQEIQRHKDEPLKCFRLWLYDGRDGQNTEAPQGVSSITKEDSTITNVADAGVELKALNAVERTRRYAKLLRDISQRRINVREGDRDEDFKRVEPFFPTELLAFVDRGPECNGPQPGDKRPRDDEDDTAAQAKQLRTGSPVAVDKRVARRKFEHYKPGMLAANEPSTVNNRLEHIRQHYATGLKHEINKILGHVTGDHGIRALDKPEAAARFATEVVDLLEKHVNACGEAATKQKRLMNTLENDGVPSTIIASASATKADIEKYARDLQNEVNVVLPMIAEIKQIPRGETS